MQFRHLMFLFTCLSHEWVNFAMADMNDKSSNSTATTFLLMIIYY